MRLSSCVAAFAIALFSSAVIAADAPPKVSLVHGTVDSFNAKTLAIKTDTGMVMSLPVTSSTHFAIVLKRRFDQLKPDDYLGVTAVPGTGGHLRAEEIHTIPLRGMGEGQYPWAHHPDNVAAAAVMPASMTNGTLMRIRPADSATNGTVAAAGASQLTLSYHGAAMVDGKCEGVAVPGHSGCQGTAIVDVTPDTVIEAIVPSFHPDVKPGLAVVAAVETDAAGHQSLTSATLESNGIKPEF
jgi:hypothetical protein